MRYLTLYSARCFRKQNSREKLYLLSEVFPTAFSFHQKQRQIWLSVSFTLKKVKISVQHICVFQKEIANCVKNCFVFRIFLSFSYFLRTFAIYLFKSHSCTYLLISIIITLFLYIIKNKNYHNILLFLFSFIVWEEIGLWLHSVDFEKKLVSLVTLVTP